MKYALDTEFLENGRTVLLLSIGIVAEDGREYYAEVAGVDYAQANPWVQEHVLPQLGQDSRSVRTCSQIRADLLSFIGDSVPEFWGYYSAYDWVLLTQLIGDFAAYQQTVPSWPKICFDLEQEIRMRGFSLQTQQADHHHALADARWILTEIKRLGF